MAAKYCRQILAWSSNRTYLTQTFACLNPYNIADTQGLPDSPPAKDALDAARKGYRFFKEIQSEDGHWPGEYGGPMFPLGGLVIGSYVADMEFTEPQRLEMIRYLFNRAHPDDGGWGLWVHMILNPN